MEILVVLVILVLLGTKYFLLKLFTKKKYLECFYRYLGGTAVSFIFATITAFAFGYFILPVYGVFSRIIWLAAVYLIAVLAETGVYFKSWRKIGSNKLFAITAVINIFVILPAACMAMFWVWAVNEEARRVSCCSNLKSIGLAMKQYALDNKNFFPNKDGAAGFEQLRSGQYLTDFRTFRCPSLRPAQNLIDGPLKESDVDLEYKGGIKDSEEFSPYIPLVWDKKGNHHNYGNVLFIDGHAQGFHGKNWQKKAGIKKYERADGTIH